MLTNHLICDIIYKEIKKGGKHEKRYQVQSVSQ